MVACSPQEKDSGFVTKSLIQMLSSEDVFTPENRTYYVSQLQKLLQEDVDTCLEQIEKNGRNWTHLPDLLASVALAELREGRLDTAGKVLNISLARQPNHALSIGIKGIELALRDQPLKARTCLERADLWQQANPWIDHALGSLLVEFPSTADRSRGKWLLKRTINSNHPELRFKAAQRILTDPSIPLLAHEIEAYLPILQEASAFERMTTKQLSFLTQRIAPISPIHGHAIAQYLTSHQSESLDKQVALANWFLTAGFGDLAADLMQQHPHEGESIHALRILHFVASNSAEEAVTLLKENPGQLDPEDVRNLFTRILPTAQLSLSTEASLIEQILKNETISPPHGIALLSRLIELRPLHLDRWAEFAKNKYLSTYPSATIRWLISLGFIDMAKACVERMPDSHNKSLLKFELHIATGHYAEASKFLKDNEELFTQSTVAYYKCLIAYHVEEVPVEEKAFVQAHQAGRQSGDYPTLVKLSVLSYAANQPSVAYASLLEAYDAGYPLSLQSILFLQDLSFREAGAHAALRIAAKMQKAFPENPHSINNFAYFSFLTNQLNSSLLRKMEKVVNDEPDIVEYRLTLALGFLLTERPQEALRLIESVPIDWNRLSHRSRLIYALILKGDRQDLAAAGLAASIESTDLVHEELLLLDTI
jgi:thioredoxin-like negative regulator of GroEL